VLCLVNAANREEESPRRTFATRCWSQDDCAPSFAGYDSRCPAVQKRPVQTDATQVCFYQGESPLHPNFSLFPNAQSPLHNRQTPETPRHLRPNLPLQYSLNLLPILMRPPLLPKTLASMEHPKNVLAETFGSIPKASMWPSETR